MGNQVYRESLTLYRGGWSNHPAAKMFKGHEYYFCLYNIALAKELFNRKKPDGSPKWNPLVCKRWLTFWMVNASKYENKKGHNSKPSWLGDNNFHISHQSNLLRKDPQYYSKFFLDVPHDLEYVWPVA